MVRHAHAAEDKQARRQAILDAAGALFVAGDGSLPAAAEIATAAVLAKGTVYLYFRTKEEIFTDLLLQACLAALDRIEASFAVQLDSRRTQVATFVTTYVGHVAQYPLLLRLDAMSHSILEKNLDAAKLRDFKLTFVSRLVATGTVVEQALRLSPGRGTSLLMRSFALTRGLWQSSSADDCVVDPALVSIQPPFDQELAEALTEYWRGALIEQD